MIYLVQNYLTGNQEVFSEEELDNSFPKLIAGDLEIIDEIDPSLVEVKG